VSALYIYISGTAIIVRSLIKELCWHSHKVMLAFLYSYVGIPIELCWHSYIVMLAFL